MVCRRRLLILVLGAMVLAACAGNSGGGANSPSGGPIRIGVMAPFAGPAAYYGDYIGASLDLAVEDLGDEVDGRRIELVKVDEGCDPKVAAGGVRRLIGKVVAIIGPACSGSAEAVAPILARAKIPFLALALASELTDGSHPYLVRAMANSDQQMEALAQFASSQGYRSIALIHDTFAYGAGDAESAKRAFPEASIKGVVPFEPGTTDFSGQIERLRQANADAICICSTYETDGGNLVRQLRQQGLTTPFLLGNFGAEPTFYKAAGGDAALSNAAAVAQYSVKDQPDPEVAHFIETISSKFDGSITDAMVVPYVAYAVLLDALDRAGSDASSEEVYEAVKATDINVLGQGVSFDANGQLAAPSLLILKWEAGEPHLVEAIQLQGEG